MAFIKLILGFGFLLFFVAALADEGDTQARQSMSRLMKNIENSGVNPGVVIASPSKSHPNYFFHWVRDAAITMRLFAETYANSPSSSQRKFAYDRLVTWVNLENRLQQLEAESGLGEPKFNIDGSVFKGPWGRPQNDGPALRALTMTQFAQALLKNGGIDYVKSQLYDGKIPAQTPIKRDLEYVAHHWQDPSFDLWEEVKADHFYTRVVQYAALKAGALLAQQLDDGGASSFYEQQANEIFSSLRIFYTPDLIAPTRNIIRGGEEKKSDLDVAVVLAFLHVAPLKEFSFLDERLLSSMRKIEKSFDFYEINKNTDEAFAIGRYPEDVYDGDAFSGGNPWFLATSAFAEASCRQAMELKKSRKIKITNINREYLQSVIGKELILNEGDLLRSDDEAFLLLQQNLQAKGESYLARVLKHAGRDGSMSEQYSRENGFMQGARELTWSHVAYLNAYQACYHKKLRFNH